MHYPVKKEDREGVQMSDIKKLVIPLPVVVEGKYDKMKLSQVIDADIITTDGFRIFNKKEKIALIKRLAVRGVVLLCDSDGAGGVIRRCVMNAVPKDKIYNLYIPKIEGKEKRKKTPSKEGTLGVEGMDEDLLRGLFLTLANNIGIDCESGRMGGASEKAPITKADLYEFGFTGAADSAAKRDILCKEYDLPSGMTPKALLGALNILTDKDGFIAIAGRICAASEEV